MNSLHGNNQQAGLSLTLFATGAICSRPFVGKWLGELGRKKILLAGLILFSAISIVYLGVNSVLFLLVLRLFHGISLGTSTTATATLASDWSPDHRKGEALGYFAMTMSLAMVIGPFVGLTIINHFNYSILFVVCTIFAFIALFFGSLIGTVPATDSQQNQQRQGNGTSLDWKHFIEPKAIPVSLMAAILAFSFAGLAAFIPIYAKQLGLGSITSFFFVIFAVLIICSRPIVGPLFDRIGPNIVVYPAIFIFAAGLVVLSQAHTPLVFLGSAAIIGLGYGALLPSLQTLAVQSASPQRRGLATSTFFLFFDLGIATGSFLLGSISAHTSFRFMYLLCSVAMAFLYVLYYFLHHRKSGTKQNNHSIELT
jgi:predicted MFS family arabinose efflux permease